MNKARTTRLKWIKSLMLFSQALLLLFTVQWMLGQYKNEKDELKKNLTEIFTNVQEKISDSLVLTHVLPSAATTAKDPDMAVLEATCDTCSQEQSYPVSLSRSGIHKILAATPISRDQQNRLFRMDTIAFNEMFMTSMKHSGWNFNSSWVNNPDSNKKDNAIFIKSSFFTTENGIVIDNFGGYMFWKLLPQGIFVVVLLTLTGLAFGLMYRSLRSQIKLSEMKDDFISNMSHELKTPIATVKVALEALTNFNAIEDPVRSREYLGMATSEMDRLELLATRVLNTALLEDGKIYLQQESYDLKQLVAEVTQAMQLRAERQGATISFNVTGSSFLIQMDKLHMQGVMVNLIDNSLKYGIAPVHIDINLVEQGGKVQLTFSDNGPGIPEEYKEKIFEKFFRVPTGNRHNTKGHGLGLSYAAQVMRQHNGSIGVANIAHGGCRFTLSF